MFAVPRFALAFTAAWVVSTHPPALLALLRARVTDHLDHPPYMPSIRAACCTLYVRFTVLLVRHHDIRCSTPTALFHALHACGVNVWSWCIRSSQLQAEGLELKGGALQAYVSAC